MTTLCYKCPRCGYTTDRLSNYKYHLEKKNLCEGTLDLYDEYVKYNIDFEDRYKALFTYATKKQKLTTIIQTTIPTTKEEVKMYYIYNIYCKDENIKDNYVGHTADPEDRKRSHVKATYNLDHRDYHLKVYEKIRETKGWENWTYKVIDRFQGTKQEALEKEEEYRKTLNATLNTYVCVR